MPYLLHRVVSCCGVAWHDANGPETKSAAQSKHARLWGTWAAEDYALVVVLAAWFWLSGLMVKQLSTTVAAQHLNRC